MLRTAVLAMFPSRAPLGAESIGVDLAQTLDATTSRAWVAASTMHTVIVV